MRSFDQEFTGPAGEWGSDIYLWKPGIDLRHYYIQSRAHRKAQVIHRISTVCRIAFIVIVVALAYWGVVGGSVLYFWISVISAPLILIVSLGVWAGSRLDRLSGPPDAYGVIHEALVAGDCVSGTDKYKEPFNKRDKTSAALCNRICVALMAIYKSRARQEGWLGMTTWFDAHEAAWTSLTLSSDFAHDVLRRQLSDTAYMLERVASDVGLLDKRLHAADENRERQRLQYEFQQLRQRTNKLASDVGRDRQFLEQRRDDH
jgi:hypothetical protein